MPKKWIIVSDLNGEEVSEGEGATVTITRPGSDQAQVLEITAAEANDLFPPTTGRMVKRRGRRSTAAESGNGATAPAATEPAATGGRRRS